MRARFLFVFLLSLLSRLTFLLGRVGSGLSSLRFSQLEFELIVANTVTRSLIRDILVCFQCCNDCIVHVGKTIKDNSETFRFTDLIIHSSEETGSFIDSLNEGGEGLTIFE